jgi:hypothetical protein
MRLLSWSNFIITGLLITAQPTLVAQNSTLNSWSSTQAEFSSTDVKQAGARVNRLEGRYAFELKGSLISDGPSNHAFPSHDAGVIGSFVVDGRGNITSGTLDFNSSQNRLVELPFKGTYMLDANGIGTMTWTSTVFNHTFALYTSQADEGVDSATFLENDGAAGFSGFLRRQKVSALVGSYRFSLDGETFETINTPSQVAIAGKLGITQGFLQASATVLIGSAANTKSVIVTSNAFSTAITNPDQNGRFKFTLAFAPNAPIPPVECVGYVVDAQHFVSINIEQPTSQLPFFVGSAEDESAQRDFPY